MKVFNTILKIINAVLITAVLLFVFAVFGVKLFGVQVYMVLSGSMEPYYNTGGLVYAIEVEPETLEVGDDITFKLSGSDTIATHRIIAVEQDENGNLQFRTKGTANEYEDAAPVPAANVLGKPVFHIPKLGYAINYMQHPPGTYVVIGVGAGLLMLLMLPDLLKEDDKEKAKKATAEAGAEGEPPTGEEPPAEESSGPEEP